MIISKNKLGSLHSTTTTFTTTPLSLSITTSQHLIPTQSSAKLKEDEARLWVTSQQRRRLDQDHENVGNRLDKSCKPGSKKACSTDPFRFWFSWIQVCLLGRNCCIDMKWFSAPKPTIQIRLESEIEPWLSFYHHPIITFQYHYHLIIKINIILSLLSSSYDHYHYH